MTEGDEAGDKAGMDRRVRPDDAGDRECHSYPEWELEALEALEAMAEKNVLVVAHGDLDGVVSAALAMGRFGLNLETTEIVFSQPYLVDKVEVPEKIEKVFVVDIAVNNRDPEMTRKFIEKMDDRGLLGIWCDHHQGWPTEIVGRIDFWIKETEACAEMLGDLDDSKWITDAIVSDTREGELSEQGQLIEQAMKADLSDDTVREAAVRWIVNGCEKDSDYQRLQEAQGIYQKVQAETEELAKQYKVRNGVAVVDVREAVEDYDRTQLLLKGEQMVPTKTAVLLGKNPEGEEIVTVATMDKAMNLVDLFGLPSGAPFRVSLPAANGWTVEKVIEKLNQ